MAGSVTENVIKLSFASVQSTNHLLCGFYLHFLLKPCFKSLQAHQTSRWLVHGRDVIRRG